MVDVQAQIDSVTRALRTGEVDGAPARVQTIAQDYRADLDDVWDAATSAERIARWFLPVTGDLQLGGRYQLEGNAGGEVLECSPPADGAASYLVTWEFGGGTTWVSVRLTARDGGGTRFSSSTSPARRTSRPRCGTRSARERPVSAGTAACSAWPCTWRTPRPR